MPQASLGRVRPVGGIDLAGSEHRSTGVSLLRPTGETETTVVHTDGELWDWISASNPRLVLVDAPLSLPRGRTTLDQREPFHFRECDRELRRLRIPFFPITLGPMRLLTTRGIALRHRLEGAGRPVFEGYPGGAQDLWGFPRKQAGEIRLQRALRSTGCWGSVERTGITHDELDAITLALVARAHVQRRTIVIGDPAEGLIVLPRPGSSPSPAAFRWTQPSKAARAPLRRSWTSRTPGGRRARNRS